MNEIQGLLKDLYLISGLNLSLFDIDGNLLTSYPTEDSPFCALIKSSKEGEKKCMECDWAAFDRVKKSGKIDIYNCYFMLYEAAVPLYTYGTLTGYLMMGQTLTNSKFEKEIIRNKALNYVDDEKKLDQAMGKISVHSLEQIKAFASIIDILGKYITLTNRIEAKHNNLAYEIKKYIMTHYQQEITIQQLCDYFYCSRATLINKFKNEYHTTIHRYILDYRLEKSAELLKGNYSIKDIAMSCGFNDSNYYSKAFKRKYHVSPLQYRLKHKILFEYPHE